MIVHSLSTPTEEQRRVIKRLVNGGGPCPVCRSRIVWIPEETIWVCGCTEMNAPGAAAHAGTRGPTPDPATPGSGVVQTDETGE